ncbi:putative thiol oxidase [Helianthus anomalus]
MFISILLGLGFPLVQSVSLAIPSMIEFDLFIITNKHENDHVTHSNVLDPGQITQADVEEATIIAFDMILENKMVKPESRGTLIKFMQLMVSRHLSRRFDNPPVKTFKIINFDICLK